MSTPIKPEPAAARAPGAHTQKVEALGHLAASVAHDINNILSVILSAANMQMEELPPGTPPHEDAKEIERAVKRAAALTRQLLIFARKQVGEPRVLDPRYELESIATFVRRLLGNVVFDLQLPNRLSRLWIDAAQFEQLILNLVINARDAMPEGGTVTLKARNCDVPETGDAAFPGLAAGRYVEISVSDTGVGIAEEHRARVFEPYFTTKPQGVGTGIGLATVLTVVRNADGVIDVSSELGKGTTFRALFPRAPTSADPTALSIGPPANLRGAETVLVVDDDENVLRIVCKLIQQAGYEVLSARGPGEALLIAEQHPVPIHLLLADIVMPRMAGDKLALRMTELRPEIHVLYMSGDGTVGLGERGLAKPFTRAELLISVRKAIAGPAGIPTVPEPQG